MPAHCPGTTIPCTTHDAWAPYVVLSDLVPQQCGPGTIIILRIMHNVFCDASPQTM